MKVGEYKKFLENRFIFFTGLISSFIQSLLTNSSLIIIFILFEEYLFSQSFNITGQIIYSHGLIQFNTNCKLVSIVTTQLILELLKKFL
jgi:hypothetical protein